MGLSVLAGTVSTVIFASSMLPMLAKAVRTKDPGSYSLGNIVLSNVGKVIHSVYVPPACDPEGYQQRNTGERCINKLKGFRDAHPHDERANIYAGTVDLASVRI
ncbi:MAG: hypothetical protein ACRDWI_08850 [Jiangellaceae bacterium]